MKAFLSFFLITYWICGSSQVSIIPNGSFEDGIVVPRCNPNQYSSCIPCFNDDISNWDVAVHNNDKESGFPDWIDYSNCGLLNNCQQITQLPPSNRFIAIKADLYKCKKKFFSNSYNIKKTHEAVGVEMIGGNLTQWKEYTLRMKLIPIKAEHLDNTPESAPPLSECQKFLPFESFSFRKRSWYLGKTHQYRSGDIPSELSITS